MYVLVPAVVISVVVSVDLILASTALVTSIRGSKKLIKDISRYDHI